MNLDNSGFLIQNFFQKCQVQRVHIIFRYFTHFIVQTNMQIVILFGSNRRRLQVQLCNNNFTANIKWISDFTPLVYSTFPSPQVCISINVVYIKFNCQSCFSSYAIMHPLKHIIFPQKIFQPVHLMDSSWPEMLHPILFILLCKFSTICISIFPVTLTISYVLKIVSNS